MFRQAFEFELCDAVPSSCIIQKYGVFSEKHCGTAFYSSNLAIFADKNLFETTSITGISYYG